MTHNVCQHTKVLCCAMTNKPLPPLACPRFEKHGGGPPRQDGVQWAHCDCPGLVYLQFKVCTCATVWIWVGENWLARAGGRWSPFPGPPPPPPPSLAPVTGP